MSRVVCFGELLLRMSAPGRELLLQTAQLTVHPGGAEANVGVSLAQFGHDVSMVSTVPANPLGQFVAGELRRHRVDSRHVQTRPGRMGLYFLTTGAVQRASEVVYDRVDSAFSLGSAADYDWSTLLDGVEWLHLSGVSPALNPAMAEATLAAAQAACARGVKVSFDGNFRPSLWARWEGDAPRILRELFACAHVAFADYRDIGVVLGGEFPQADVGERVDAAAAQAFAAFPRLQWMACTQRTPHSVDHHSLGAMLIGRDGTRAVAAAREMVGIVDRIGGGDAFAAGILHGMMRDFDPQAIVRFGLAAAILKHSIPGDFNLVSEADVMALTGEERFDVRR